MKHLMKLVWALGLSALLSFGPLSFAADDPQKQVEDTTARLLDNLRQNKAAYEADHDLLYEMVNTEILKHFDFKRMARLVLGKHWKKANAAQQDEFVAEFKQLVVRTYALSVLKFTNQTVSFKPMTGNIAKRKVTIHSEVLDLENGQRIPLAYSLYKPKGEWLVYDVKVDSVSLVINYKSTYDQRVRQAGLDALIAELKSKNAEKK